MLIPLIAYYGSGLQSNFKKNTTIDFDLPVPKGDSVHSVVDAVFVKCIAAGTEPNTGMAFKNIFLDLFYAPNCRDAVAAGRNRSTKSEARVSVTDHDAELKGLLLLVSITMMNISNHYYENIM